MFSRNAEVLGKRIAVLCAFSTDIMVSSSWLPAALSFLSCLGDRRFAHDPAGRHNIHSIAHLKISDSSEDIM
jgi:hypothetical protein